MLFDKGVIRLGYGLNMERHTRIKIFNVAGETAAKQNLIYDNSYPEPVISDLEGETINLENGKLEITPLTKKQIQIEKLGKNFSAMIFTLPNVKPGSVIEYKYKSLQSSVWNFQGILPVRYSEIETENLARSREVYAIYVKQPFAKNIGETTENTQIKALANIHSLVSEPYMAAWMDNLERIEFFRELAVDTSWSRAGRELSENSTFKNQFTGTISGEGEIVRMAKSLSSIDNKLAFLFDTVRNRMTWNNGAGFYAVDGAGNAWNKMTGNFADINLALYFLLKKAGIKAFPMLISTRNHGRINSKIADLNAFNSLVIYLPIDSSNFYVLDASGKYNLFNTTPFYDLNSSGLVIDIDHRNCWFILLDDKLPIVQFVSLNADIIENGKLTGTAEINSDHYNKSAALERYNFYGKDNYIESLSKFNRNALINSFEMDNMNIDSLPLTQKFNFSEILPGSDENHIYLSTNIFTFMAENPFVAESRYSDIDFGFRDNFAINDIYKIPIGFKTEALPQTITITMPDQSIIFKRTIAEDNGTILIRYSLNHKKTIYSAEEYQDLRGFYKKMYEVLNEQIVLKKE